MKVQKLSVVTFNTQGGPIFSINTYDRINKVAVLLNLINVDIINLQEVFTYKHLNIFKNKLSNFRYCVFERLIFGPKGGIVTFSKIPIRKQEFISYSSLALFKSSSLKAFIKNLFIKKGILINKIKNSSIFVVNSHLTANIDNNWSKSSRSYPIHKSQIGRLIDSVKLIKSYSIIILNGDFNVSKSSAFYSELIAGLKVKDIFRKYNFPTFHKEFMLRNESSNRIDYLLIKARQNNKFSVLGRQHIFNKPVTPKDINHGFASDHIGLKATLKLS